MATGRITDFSKPNQQQGFKRLEQTRRGGNVEVFDRNKRPEPTPVELRVHEEVIVPDQGNVRVKLKKDGTPDLRFRNAPSRAEWEKIKRLEDK